MMISKDLLKTVILSNRDYILQKIKRIVRREKVTIPAEIDKTVAFYGVRRSGKTFILYALFRNNPENAFYLDFEDDRLDGFELQDFEKVTEAIRELQPEFIKKEFILLLDEIHRVPGWERFCRRVTERENIRVFITGSSSRVMPAEIHTALRGRVWSMEVLPFSFREYLQASGIEQDTNDLLYGPAKPLLMHAFQNYLRWGGFPEVTLLKDDFEKEKVLKDYLNAMFFKDLAERYRITNIPLLEMLFDKLFSSFSTRLSLLSIYKQFKDKIPFSKDLLYQYYKYFIQSMLIYEVQILAESAYKRMRNPNKIYVADTGLCKRVTSEDKGRLLENVIFLELHRNGYDVFYFQGKNKCDFIAEKNNRFLPIQVCYKLTGENQAREINGLIEACRYLDVKKGYVITSDEKETLQRDGIMIEIIPACEWLITYPGRYRG